MFVVFSYFTDEGEVCLAYRKGGIGTAIGQAIGWCRLTDSTLLQVRCLGQRLTEQQALELFRSFKTCPSLWDGRAIWKNGEVLDRHSDKRL
jgi:hypothetical protein